MIAFLWMSCVISGGMAYAETTNRIVAIVNDDVITEADVLASTNALLEQQHDSPASESPSGEIRRVALGRLIEQHLLLQEAKRENITVASDEVLERLDALRRRFHSDEEFEQSLADSHLTIEPLKEKLRDQLMVQRLIDAKIRAAIVVSPQEVASAVAVHPELAKPGDRVRAAEILVRVSEERSVESAKARIQEVYTQLKRGADFAALAKQYSEDSHAQEGGEMGWVAQGELMPELDTVLLSVAPGEYSQPVQTRLGFHLVKVEERRPSSSVSAPDANRTIYQQLYQQKFQEAFVRWLTQLKEHAYIDIPRS